MTRTLFVILLILQLFLFIAWQQADLGFGGILIFITTFALVVFRRRYLDMKPWWGGQLKDIPRYFKKP